MVPHNYLSVFISCIKLSPTYTFHGRIWRERKARLLIYVAIHQRVYTQRIPTWPVTFELKFYVSTLTESACFEQQTIDDRSGSVCQPRLEVMWHHVHVVVRPELRIQLGRLKAEAIKQHPVHFGDALVRNPVEEAPVGRFQVVRLQNRRVEQHSCAKTIQQYREASHVW